MIKKIDASQFQNEVLNEKNILVFVDFYADWCGPCRLTSPIIEELANELPNVKFIKINVDENSELASRYSILSIPTFLFFKNGEVVHQMVGANSKQRFAEEINKFL